MRDARIAHTCISEDAHEQKSTKVLLWSAVWHRPSTVDWRFLRFSRVVPFHQLALTSAALPARRVRSRGTVSLGAIARDAWLLALHHQRDVQKCTSR